MKRFFRKIGFRYMDEMEMEIMFGSLRWAFIFSEAALLALVIYELVTTAELGWPFAILLGQNLVLLITNLVLNGKMGGGENAE